MKIKLFLQTLLLTSATLMATETPIVIPFEVGGGYLNHSSSNCRWATYMEPMGDGEALPDPVAHIIDLSTGKQVDLVDESLGESDGVICYDVTDDGSVVVGSLNSKPAYYKDGKWTRLNTGDPVADRLYTGSVRSVSADGSWMCGWMYADFNTMSGYVWHNGERVALTNLPCYDDMLAEGIIEREDMPENKDKKPNIIFNLISSDGTKVVGGVDHNHYGWGASWILYDIPTQTYRWLGDETVRHRSFINDVTMSNNGRWLTGRAQMFPEASEAYEAIWRYDVENDKFEIFADIQDSDMLASAIADDGTMFGASPCMGTQRMLSVRVGGLWIDLATMLYQNYGLNILDLTGYDTTGYATCISSDMQTLVAQAEHRSSAYVLTLPVSITEAARSVNMLTQWAADPAPSTSFSAITDIRLYLSYSCEWTGKLPCVELDGKVIAEAKEVKTSGSTGKVYILSFGEVRMEPDKEYEVVVHESAFKVTGTTMTNPEIRFSYVGRLAEPVKPISILPAPGSPVNELSQTSKVTVTFDADLSISPKASAYLYDKESNQPLSALSIVVDGNKVSLMPPASRKLNKGREYEVKISAGSLTDMMGLNGNAEFTIPYSGAFVPGYKPGKYLFEENFDEPTASLERFLLFEGDHRMPVSSMQELGFDANNTPWNFSVRDDEAYDYCAASHSDYSPAGESDDWMVTSRIKVPNKFCKLNFDAQSMKAGSGDRLKVYVWPCDETYGSLDKETMNQLRSESIRIFDRQIPEGLSGGCLEGNWNEYALSLEQFNGKNIYIAFANENNTPGMLFVDNVRVESDGSFEIGSLVEERVVDLEATVVKGIVTLRSVTPESVVVSFEGGGVSESKTIDTREVEKGGQVEFEFETPMPLARGASTSYSISGVVEGEMQIVSGNVADLMFEPHKRVLIEEGTGAWCGNCPRGILALEYLERVFPDHVVAVAVHNGDIYAYDDYTNFNALGGYPSARINRGAPSSPMTAEHEFQSTGVETWADVVVREMEIPTLGEIEIEKVVRHTEDETLEVWFNTRFAMNLEDVDYNVFTCVVEDHLPGLQSNYLSGGTSGNFGGWADEGPQVLVDYVDVARQVFDEQYMGVARLIPSDIIAGESYPGKASAKLYGNIKDMANIKTVVAIINAASGEVINVARFSGCETKDNAGVNGPVDFSQTVLSVVDGCILVDGCRDNLEILNTAGMKVSNGDLVPGIYIVRLPDQSVKKIMVY